MSSRDLDKMLADWPTVQPSDTEREDFAARVVDSINAESMGRMDASTEALLSPPLPARESEGNLAASAVRPGDARASFPSVSGVENKMSKDRAKDRTSFQELAKLAGTPAPQPVTPSVTPPPAAVVRAEEGGSDDSGIVDLKMVAEMDPAASERAKSTPLAASGLFDEDAPASAAATSASSPPASVGAVAQAPTPAVTASVPPAATPSVAPASASASVAPAVPKKDEKKKGGGVVIILGGLLAVGAIAAGAVFMVKSGMIGGKTDSVAATTTAKPAETATVAATTQATAAASVAAADTGPTGVDMDTLPGTADTTGAKRTMPRINAANGGTKPAATASADTTPPPAGSIDPKLVAGNIPNSNTGGSGDLTAAMKAAAGGGSATTAATTTAGPTYAPGSVPQKPSQGQVQGAINAVLPEARKCMADGDPISRATIVFQSDGSVQSVSVSGFAAGKPNEACVKAAFQKAKISPFAEASYSFPVTVRPM